MVPDLIGKVPAHQRINASELAGRLLCDVDVARGSLATLRRAHESVRSAFDRWWTTGEMENISAMGTSVREIQRERGTDPLSALLIMDGVLQGQLDPRDASHADATA